MSIVISILKRIRIYQVIIGIGIFVLFAQYFWKILYVCGVVPGPYWLFVFIDQWFLGSISCVFYLIAFIFVFWILGLLLNRKISAQLIKVSGALVFAGFAIMATFPVVIARHTVHIDKLQVEGNIYYLSGYPFGAEVNYSVAKCEFTGQLCKTIFISGDIVGTDWLNSHLEYDDHDKKLLLMEVEEGAIFLESLH